MWGAYAAMVRPPGKHQLWTVPTRLQGHPRRRLRHLVWRPILPRRQRRQMYARSYLAVLQDLASQLAACQRIHQRSGSADLFTVLAGVNTVSIPIRPSPAMDVFGKDGHDASLLRGAVHMGLDCSEWMGSALYHPKQHHQRVDGWICLLFHRCGVNIRKCQCVLPSHFSRHATYAG
jgi:hypothetical protein